jgi:hypothetical protein
LALRGWAGRQCRLSARVAAIGTAQYCYQGRRSIGWGGALAMRVKHLNQGGMLRMFTLPKELLAKR